MMKIEEKEKEKEKGKMHDMISAGLLYSLSSIVMLLVNKLAVKSYHQTFTLLSMQNIATLVIRYMFTYFFENSEFAAADKNSSSSSSSSSNNNNNNNGNNIGNSNSNGSNKNDDDDDDDRDNRGKNVINGNNSRSHSETEQAIIFLPAVFLFILMLFSSLISLSYVSIATVIVFRNINSLAVAFGDKMLLGHQISTNLWISLFVIILGSFIYAQTDLDYDFVGYIWTFINIGAQCGYAIYVKWLLKVRKYPTMTLVFYNNAISTPVFILAALLVKEPFSAFTDLYYENFWGFFWVVFSFPFAFCLSFSGFWAQKVFTPTTFVTINNLNKIPVIIAGVYIFNDFLSYGSFFGLCVSLIGGAMYSMAAQASSNSK